MHSDNITELTRETFKPYISQSRLPVAVNFWAEGSAPCSMLFPILEEIAVEYASRLKVCSVNVDDAGVLSAEYMILNIPTVVFFKDGELLGKSVGLKTHEGLKAIIDKLL